MILPITTEPNPILHQRSADVILADLKSPAMKKLIADMTETMYAKDGVGIASVQVGQPIQLCVIAKNYNPLNKNEDLYLINPNWTKISRRQSWDEEGCLSVPKLYGKVKRYLNIRIKALNKLGEPTEFIAKDFPARIIQHEIDHLNGILFIDKAKNLHELDKSSL